MEISIDTCIICAVSAPIVKTEQGGGIDNTKLLSFQKENLVELKLGLQLFWKMLKVDENLFGIVNPLLNCGDKDNEVIGNYCGKLSCCSDCWRGLKELIRLQKAFKEIQDCLFKQVEDLKTSLLKKPSKKKSTLNRIRDQLINCAENKTNSVTQISSPSPFIPKTTANHQNIIIQPCSVKLTRLSPSSGILPAHQQAQQKNKDDDDDDITISQFSDNDNYDDNFEDESTTHILKEDLEYKPSVKKSPKSSRKPKRKKKTDSELKKIKINPSDYFVKLSENLLLYKSTLVGVNYGEYFHCLGVSSNCNFISKGTDYQAFEQIKDHLNTSHLEKLFIQNCPKCGNELTDKEIFRDHIMSCYGNEKSYICTSCWKPLKSKDGVKLHQWSHKNLEERGNSEKPFSRVKNKSKDSKGTFYCEYEGCGKSFILERYLRAHQYTHLPKDVRKQFNCPQCSRIFLTAVAVRGHIEREHNKNLMRFRYCPICNKQYNWRNGEVFRTHVKSHTRENLSICEECGKSFMRKDSLKYHKERYHSENSGGGGKIFQCEFCEKRYSHFGGLERHKKAVHN